MLLLDWCGYGVENDGSLFAWQDSRRPQVIGIPANSRFLTPVRVVVPAVRDIAVGGGLNTCVITRDEHRVFCWGTGVFAQDDVVPIPTEIELLP
jgi:hypothetical protein